MSKRIALEARSLSTHGGGVKNYTKEIISRITSNSSDFDYFVYYDSPKYIGAFPDTREKSVRVFNPALRIFWDYFSLPYELKKDKIDFVHYFKPATTFLKIAPAIATMYDIIPLLYPETQTLVQRSYWRNQLPLTAKKCRHLITISEASKKDIVQTLQVNPENITVTPLGVSAEFHPVDDLKKNAARLKYGLPEKFILYLGTIEPRKNIARLIRAFNEIAGDFPHALVIAGKWGWNYSEIERELKKSPYSSRILTLSYVNGRDLPSLYSAADVFVFPSFYEGFGLPPLEAMACGTPVITSNVSSLPEVVGNSGVLINPFDEKDIATGMIRVLENETIKDRLSRAGIERAKEFNWDNTAKATIDVYNKIFK